MSTDHAATTSLRFSKILVTSTALMGLLAGCSEDEFGHCTVDECPASIEFVDINFFCLGDDSFQVELAFAEGAIDSTPEPIVFYEISLRDQSEFERYVLRANGSSGRDLGGDAWAEPRDGGQTQLPAEAVSLTTSSGTSRPDILDLTIDPTLAPEVFGQQFNSRELEIFDVTTGYKAEGGDWQNFKKQHFSMFCTSPDF